MATSTPALSFEEPDIGPGYPETGSARANQVLRQEKHAVAVSSFLLDNLASIEVEPVYVGETQTEQQSQYRMIDPGNKPWLQADDRVPTPSVADDDIHPNDMVQEDLKITFGHRIIDGTEHDKFGVAYLESCPDGRTETAIGIAVHDRHV